MEKLKLRSWDSVLEEVVNDDKNKYDVRGKYCTDLRMDDETGMVSVRGKDDEYVMSDCATKQICTKYKIPYDFWRTQLDVSDKAYLFNKFSRNNNMWVMLRCRDFGGDEPQYIRGIVGKNFGALDNRFVLEQIEQVESKKSERGIVGFVLDDLYMNLKLVDLDSYADYQPLDTWYGGVAIGGSEVGKQNALVEGLMFRMICTNGAMVQEGKEAFMDKRYMGKVRDEFLLDYKDAINKAYAYSSGLVSQVYKLNDAKIKNVEEFFDDTMGTLRVVVPAIFRDEVGRTLKKDKNESGLSDSMYEFINALTYEAQRLEVPARNRVERLAGAMLRDGILQAV